MSRNRSALLVAGSLLVGHFGLAATANAEPVSPLYRLVDTAAQRLATADPVAAFKWINGGRHHRSATRRPGHGCGRQRRHRPRHRRAVRAQPSSPTRSMPPRQSSTRASLSGSSTRLPRRRRRPTCPSRARRSTGSTRRWSTRLRCNGIHCTGRHVPPTCEEASDAVATDRQLDRLYRQALSSATRSYCRLT